MKKVFICLTAAAVFSLSSCQSNYGKKDVGHYKSSTDSAAYILGFLNGEPYADGLSHFPGDSIDKKIFLEGLNAAVLKLESKMNREEMEKFMNDYVQKAREAEMAKKEEEAAKAKEEGEKFLEENKTKEGVQVTETGLQYKIDELGTGLAATSPKDTVVVHYKGTLLNEKEFDSSYKREEPATFPLDRVIPGWTEGFQGKPAGTKMTLWIPSSLAYGERGTPEIPGNSVLRFDCELIEVKPYVEPAK